MPSTIVDERLKRLSVLMSDVKKLPLASILVITKNDKDAIKRNLQSIFRQSYRNVEVVIVDSSDDDSPLDIKRYIKNYNASNFDVKYIHTEARGVGAARNTALKLSSGEYVFFVDADCYIPKDYVKRVVEIFSRDNKILSINIPIRQHPKDNGIFARTIHLYEHARYHTMRARASVCNHFEFWVCRKKVFEKVGLFNENLEAGEDTEWILRSKKFYQKLREDGYKAVTSNIEMYEEKRAWSFRQYWRKSVWYGEAFANLDYIKAQSVTSIIEIILMFIQVTYPLSIVLFLLNFNITYLFIAHTLGFVTPTIYIVYKARSKEKKGTLLLIPLLIFYKSVFLLLGAFRKVLNDVKNLVTTASGQTLATERE